MKLTKQQESEVMPIYKEWWHSYLNGDVKTYDHYLDDEYRFVGSTETEAFLSRKDTTKFFEATADQLAGKSQLRNSKLTAEYYAGIVFITELADAYLLSSDEWFYYGRFRFTSMLKKNEEGWRFIYQHFSTTDTKAQEGETIGLEKVSKENQELRDAIKRRTVELEQKNRDLEMEAALERVRVRSLAMHKSEELNEVIEIIYNELQKLGFDALAADLMIFTQDKMGYDIWVSGQNGTEGPYRTPDIVYSHPHHQGTMQAWIKGDELRITLLKGKLFNSYFKIVMDDTKGLQSLSDEAKSGIFSLGRIIHTEVFTQHGCIRVSSLKERSQDQIDIQKRFAKVFDQTYTRFLDLQKAEAQAREAQIDVGLERVRSAAMAMQHSDDLRFSLTKLFEELDKLQLGMSRCGIAILDPSKPRADVWIMAKSGKNNTIQLSGDEPLDTNFMLLEAYKAWKKGKDYEYILEGGKLAEYYHSLDIKFQSDLSSTFSKTEKTKRQHYFNAAFKHGSLFAFFEDQMPDGGKKILKRFSNVLNLAYSRFRDIQFAEAQTREAKIQLALERVRSSAMAMQSSQDLNTLIGKVFTECTKLDIQLDRGIIMIYDPETRDTRWWFANPEVPDDPRDFLVPYHNHVPYLTYLEGWKKRVKKWTYVLEGKEKEDWDAFIFVETELALLPSEVKQIMMGFKKVHLNASFNSFGSLTLATLEPMTDDNFDILLRFAKVFDLTYTRFNDLQKAEAQAREAQIEAALERVRAKTMAMHRSDELGVTSLLIFDELKALGEISEQISIGIFDEENQVAKLYATLHGEQWKEATKVDLDEPHAMQKIYGGWREKKKSIRIDLSGDELKAYNRFRSQYSNLKFPDEQWVIHCAFFSKGVLSFSTTTPHDEQTMQLLERFAQVFDGTYTRFLDLQKAEAQAREAQIEAALERTRTQSMLMQHSDELNKVSNVFHEQLLLLGLPSEFSYVWLPNEANRTHMFWATWSENNNGNPYSNSKAITYPLDKSEPYTAACYEMWESEQSVFVNRILPEEVADFFSSWQELVSEAENMKEELFPDGLYYAEAYMKYGCFGINIRRPLSEEEQQVLHRFSIEFERAYTRFLDLKKAEAQAREAQIETALEKVRTRTMAMQKGEELHDVAVLLYKELIALGITNFVTCGYVEVNETINRQFTWVTAPGGDTLGLFYLPLTGDATFDERYAAWKRQQIIFHQTVAGEVRSDHLEFAITTFNSKEAEEMVRSQFPDPTVFYCFNFSHGYLHLVTGSKLKKEEELLLARFTRVFEQTYARFLDLQKAEAQAREAQIETALEIVRSRSLAMHKSDELNEVVSVLFEKLKDLKIQFTAVGIGIYIEGSKDFDSYVCGENEAGLVITNYRLPYFNNQIPKDLTNALEKQLDFFVGHYSKEEKDSFYNYVLEHTPEFRHLPEDIKRMIFDSPTYTISMVAVKNAVFNINDFEGKVLAEHEVDIIKRFARVFDQAYTRFLDLQKAEAQAQEAQIEAALERVRSRSMAMHRSEELAEVASVLYQELVKLGITDFVNCGFVEIDEKNNSQKGWNTKPDGSISEGYFLPLSGEDVLDERYKAWKEQMPLFLQRVGDERLRKHMEFAIPTLGSKQVEEMVKANFPDPTYFYCCNFKYGYLSIIAGKTYSLEAEALMIRFTNAFAQTYTRFLDLQKAEAQAREVTKQASLDRVRGEISSMRSANDLDRITPLVFNELTTLGIPFIRCGVFIVHEKRKNVEIYLSTPEGKSLAVMTLPFEANEMTTQSVKAWKKEEVYVQHWNQADFINWRKSMTEQGYVKDLKTYQGAESAPENLHLHFVPFDQGLLYVGSTENLSEEQIDLVKALARSFAIAYARYEDFVKLEQAKTEVESAMSVLKATQSQLVQQEKLASLGQLTAGIAHEIKNPLNFVNNFSEVSIELIEEALEEITNVKTQNAASLQNISELLDDVQSNLHKIHEHGTRANGIVTSMLQHSRGGSGKMEPTDLNALIKEYVNLSYHGMRAGKNPINVDIVLDLDPDLGMVSLIREDFTRVVINLCNNAFDAMRTVETQHAASLRVRTKKSGDAITIEIEDNGMGIPDEIKDKILQPFFTTKKGKEGTGLGLSITHDIVKAHGGELKVKSKEGEGSEFIIQIPINQG